MTIGGKNLLGFIILIFLGVLMAQDITFASSALVRATIQITVCGNNVRETGEECDNADWGGANCVTLGYISGSLSCRPDCTFNKTNCSNSTGNQGGNAGGGGSGSATTVSTQIIVQGQAYPNSRVYLLKDGRISGEGVTDAKSEFQIVVNNPGTGDSNFVVYALDTYGNKSPSISFRTNILPNATTRISKIVVPPTANLNGTSLEPGNDLVASGQTCSNCKIRILVDSNSLPAITSNPQGMYLTTIKTDDLAFGTHELLLISDWGGGAVQGDILQFTIVEKLGKPTTGLRGDLNRDGKVNLVDFSIAAYWYKRSLSVAMTQIESETLNGDNKIDLVDFSIMAYYWTGN